MKTKSRLTITLSQDLLVKVDALIDGHTIRNRSHAIESLVKQGLSSQVRTAVILAGGQSSGKKQIPGLKQINDRPLLSITFEHLKHYGINQIVMCAGVNEKKLKAEFGNGAKYGVNIVYSSEKKPLGTAGTIKNAEKYLNAGPFLVINDSTLTNLNLEDLFDFHSNEETTATICVKPRMSEKKYGQAFLHGNKIVKFLETSDTEGISIVNVGLYILNPELLSDIPENKYYTLENDVFPKLAEKKELSAFVFQGSWFDSSTESSFNEAVEKLTKN